MFVSEYLFWPQMNFFGACCSAKKKHFLLTLPCCLLMCTYTCTKAHAAATLYNSITSQSPTKPFPSFPQQNAPTNHQVDISLTSHPAIYKKCPLSLEVAEERALVLPVPAKHIRTIHTLFWDFEKKKKKRRICGAVLRIGHCLRDKTKREVQLAWVQLEPQISMVTAVWAKLLPVPWLEMFLLRDCNTPCNDFKSRAHH